MAKKKSVSKKLTKDQLKKLKGGLVFCRCTNCIEKTCDLQKSISYCAAKASTVDIVGPNGDGSDPDTKK